MKKWTGLVLLATQLSAAVAIAAPNASQNVALDLLQLPPENRRIALANLPADQFKKLSQIAFDDSRSMQTRWAAVVSMAEANNEKSLPFLLQASRDKQWFMRNAALVALSETHPLQAEGVAKRLLQDKALVVRSAAVDVLQKYQSPSTRDLLWAELEQKYNFHQGESLWIRAQIVSTLASKPQDYEMTIFARLLKDKDVRVHAASIQGLEKLTGVRLGEESSSLTQKVSLWKDYLKKEGTL